MLKILVDDEYQFMALRLAEYDPQRADLIERACTHAQIALAMVLKKHDNEITFSDG